MMYPIKAALLALSFVSSQAKFDQFFYARPFEGTCATGVKQTPININSMSSIEAPPSWASDLHLPTVHDLKIKNTGHGLELAWDTVLDGDHTASLMAHGDGLNDILMTRAQRDLSTKRFVPLQLHFHSVSEHAIDGIYYAAEMHIVNAIARGEAPEWGCDEFWISGNAADLNLEKCITVIGVMYQLGHTTPKFLKDILNSAPAGSGEIMPLDGELDLDTILPFNRSYFTYEGSLTTPPCAEGLRWHVLKEPLSITEADLELMQQIVADTFDPEHPEITNVYRMNNRPMQPVNERDVFHVTA